ncbi:hypothetical protein [Marinoscillum furvescens]|uniref:Uncharacterized protein n=1 Tax=Marinoscillum furvescens DSM 4134 TaxID=1122208 RepID=A0A3D9L1E9_MARFU|nr:hypothetical protein [Marinoscillum furvescens]RED95557.1 hypothetical protein C7460_1176 [Marinoscillum furvescens DSM 4134]
MQSSEFKATIFNPGSGIPFCLNSKTLIYGSLATLSIIVLFDSHLHLTSSDMQIIAVLLFMLMIVGSYWGLHEKQKKHGKLNGILSINLNSIIVDGDEIPWDELTNFQFGTGPVLNEPLWVGLDARYRFFGGPAYSAGVDHFVSFDHKDRRRKIFFRLDSPSQKVKFESLMRQKFLDSHIQLQPTYDGLRLTYEEIQQLKKQKSDLAKNESS